MSSHLRHQLPGIVANRDTQSTLRWREATKIAAGWQFVPCIFSLYVSVLYHFFIELPFGVLPIFLVYFFALLVIPPAVTILHRSLRVGAIALCLPLLANGIPTAVFLLYVTFRHIWPEYFRLLAVSCSAMAVATFF